MCENKCWESKNPYQHIGDVEGLTSVLGLLVIARVNSLQLPLSLSSHKPIQFEFIRQVRRPAE